MRQEVRLFAASAALVLGATAFTWAAPPGPYTNTPAAESKGPLSEYVYKNDDGVFDLEVGGAGTAKYRWKDGRVYSDVVKFVREATFYTEDESHKGWIYECSGGGSTWWLFFGATTMGKDEKNDDLFPLYFSQEDPSKNKFDRWRTQSGTVRLRMPSGIDHTTNYGRLDAGATNPGEYRRVESIPKPLQR